LISSGLGLGVSYLETCCVGLWHEQVENHWFMLKVGQNTVKYCLSRHGRYQ